MNSSANQYSLLFNQSNYTFKTAAVMINFASLFNQYRQQHNSGLNELLDTPDIRIGQLLDQDSFLPEYKANNPKIVDFMNYKRYKEVIELVTVVGDPSDRKRSYKYPLIACDLLCADNSNALNLFLPQSPILISEFIEEEVEVEVQIQMQESAPEDKGTEERAGKSTVDNPSIDSSLQAIDQEKPLTQILQAKKQENGEGFENLQQSNKEGIKKENVLTGEQIEILQEKKENIVVNAKELSGQGQAKEDKCQKQSQPVKKKIIKQMRKISKQIKKQVAPLIDDLLSYFKGQINYTLAGYVSKVLSYLFTKRPADLLNYIFKSKMDELILKHAESRSVGDFIIRILTHQANLCLESRKEMFELILEQLSVPTQQIARISNLSAYACEIVQKIAANMKSNCKLEELSRFFLGIKTVTKLIDNAISPEESVSVYNAPILFTYLTNVPFVLPQDQQTLNSLRELLVVFIQKSCDKLKVNSSSHKKLGVGRVKLVQIFSHILKEDIPYTRQIVSEHEDFFPTLYRLLPEYELNNLLHNEIMKIVEVALEEQEGSPLNESILRNDNLINFIAKEAQEDTQIRRGESVYRSRKGYIAHLINLCLKLRKLQENNASIKRLTDSHQFREIYSGLVEKEVFSNSKLLAGYAMKKDLKHQILFQKEDILSAHLAFFQKCPSPVFDQEPDHLTTDHINIQHPDLISQLEKQLEEKNPQKAAIQEQEPVQNPREEERPKNMQAELINPSNYWVMHLDYDVDDLLAEI